MKKYSLPVALALAPFGFALAFIVFGRALFGSGWRGAGTAGLAIGFAAMAVAYWVLAMSSPKTLSLNSSDWMNAYGISAGLAVVALGIFVAEDLLSDLAPTSEPLAQIVEPSVDGRIQTDDNPTSDDGNQSFTVVGTVDGPGQIWLGTEGDDGFWAFETVEFDASNPEDVKFEGLVESPLEGFSFDNITSARRFFAARVFVADPPDCLPMSVGIYLADSSASSDLSAYRDYGNRINADGDTDNPIFGLGVSGGLPPGLKLLEDRRVRVGAAC